MKLEQQVVSLELAKQLKETGYLQEGLWCWAEDGSLFTDKEMGLRLYHNDNTGIVAPTVAELGEALLGLRNEFSQGWNDSGCFWHFQAGNRGSGNMMEGFGEKFSALSDDTEANARARMWLYLKKEGLIK